MHLSPVFSPHNQPKEFPMESPTRKLAFNADAAAILIAFTFATLIRLNIIHHIAW